jgi:hexosaminidase
MHPTLIPIPRKFDSLPGAFHIASRQNVLHKGGANEAVMSLRETLADGSAQPYAWSAQARDPVVTISIGSATGNSQGYHLTITPDGATIVGDDAAGAFYATQTFEQLARQYRDAIPCCHIQDHPDFPVRGYMLDISRDKVPTMQSLFHLIDLLAELKYNQLQLYTEHTFAYLGHEVVWKDASPMTPEEIRILDDYCKERFIDLVPNQNSFGHLDRWLKHPQYEPLAEKSDGFTFPWGTYQPTGFTLNPQDPRSLALIEDLFDQLLPNFTSNYFNVGCDETCDLGLGKSKDLCEKIGKERVYLDFLLKIYDSVKRRGKTMQFWGDIILHKPELIPELPKDVIALNWGYDAGHPFEKETRAFADAGIPFYVCPGTSSWCSITGRTDNAIANLRESAAAGLANGATGYLNTDWGDYGYLQYLPVSYLGIAAGAAFSWCLDSNKDINLPRALDLHVFHDSANVLGKLFFDLGNIYKLTKTMMGNSSRFFWALVGDQSREKYFDMLTREEYDAAEQMIDAAMSPLASSRAAREDAELIKSEVMNAAAMLRHACRRGRRRLKVEPLSDKQLTGDLQHIISEHKRLWLARNRPGGLSDSVKRLEDRLADYAQ